MSRKRRVSTTLNVDVNLSLEELAVGLAVNNSYEALYDFIRRLDAVQQDWEFTRGLKNLVDELMAEDDSMKVRPEYRDAQ